MDGSKGGCESGTVNGMAQCFPQKAERPEGPDAVLRLIDLLCAFAGNNLQNGARDLPHGMSGLEEIRSGKELTGAGGAEWVRAFPPKSFADAGVMDGASGHVQEGSEGEAERGAESDAAFAADGVRRAGMVRLSHLSNKDRCVANVGTHFREVGRFPRSRSFTPLTPRNLVRGAPYALRSG